MTVEAAVHEHGRERRKRLTRQALRSATLELGLAAGLADVSVEAIAERAGVSTRTFFNYFETKDDAALLDLFAVSAAELADLAAGDPDTTWSSVTELFVADAERSAADGADLPRYLALHAANPTVQSRQLARFARFEGELSAAVAARLGGGPDAAFTASMVAGSAITAARVGLSQWAARGRNSALRDEMQRAFAVLRPAFTSSTPR